MDGSFFPQLEDVKAARETVWENPKLLSFDEAAGRLPLDNKDIDDAEARLLRFAPFIAQRFPETAGSQGIIESPLTEIPAMKQILNERFGAGLKGRLFLKQDSELPIAGSVKARGGIYEVLKHTEELALQSGLLKDDYRIFDTEESRQFFSRYAIHVGSTGNLGLSIGIMSAAIGYRAFVHMSEDARQWKKELLRSKGVTVIEYKTDYSMAVVEGRKKAAQDPFSYFVDDENSQDLFLGYAVAARRLKKQLQDSGIAVDKAHPLFVYIPCGVGGAPGGICFGLKQEFGDDVFCIFEEPVQAPCMLLGMATGLQDGICVQDVGLSGKTAADGLAVGRPSKFVGKAVENLLSGIVTIEDRKLFELMRALLDSERIFIEPSACAAFQGAIKLKDMTKLMSSLSSEQLERACHIIWATGGSMVPEDERQRYIDTI
ncbi:MAG: D-serine ammonia-lyase [Firmicutes bacterium]|nr:D-serine ammonia-lyase [Bacillota bacterium]